jgi:hypothetical protein
MRSTRHAVRAVVATLGAHAPEAVGVSVACCSAKLLWCAASQEARWSLEEHRSDLAALRCAELAACVLTDLHWLATPRLEPMHCCILLLLSDLETFEWTGWPQRWRATGIRQAKLLAVVGG